MDVKKKGLIITLLAELLKCSDQMEGGLLSHISARELKQTLLLEVSMLHLT